MRIIGGESAGRLLKVPGGLGVRPMPDKVKLAVFNSLGGFVEGTRVLDLFSGTGALGHECLSRGAASLVRIEKSEKHARFYRSNLASIQLPASRVELRVLDVFTAIPHLAAEQRRFELIIADPPYGEKNVGKRSESLAQRLLDNLVLPELLVPGGLFVLGHTRRDTLELPPYWIERKQLRHGDTTIRMLVSPANPVQTAQPPPGNP